jgi:hypothetical protein
MKNKRTIICDIDGTLALRGDRDPYDHDTAMEDEVNRPVAEVLRLFVEAGYTLLFVSGRDEKYRGVTEYWLYVHHLDQHAALLMRSAGDLRSDGVVKTEIWHTKIKDHYDVLFVLDDRQRVVDAWRALGLTVFQVAEGNY